MTTAELAKPYGDAITNLRETAKWIVSSLAGTTGLLLGGSVLTGLGSLDTHDDRFRVALAGIAVFLLGAAFIFALAVNVLVSRTLVLRELATGPLYQAHRTEIDRLLHGQYPPTRPNLAAIETEFADAHQARSAAMAAHNDAARATAEARLTAIAPIVLQALLLGGLYDVRVRFVRLCWSLLLIAPMAAAALAYVWAINPGKDSAKDLSPAYIAALSPAEKGSLRDAGVEQKCVPANVLWLRERPAGLLDGVTLPPAGCQPTRVLRLEEGRLVPAK
jgi:hypothetical protein